MSDDMGQFDADFFGFWRRLHRDFKGALSFRGVLLNWL